MAVGFSTGERTHRIALYLAIGLNLALLIAFKYDNFIIQNVNAAFPLFHLPTLDQLPDGSRRGYPSSRSTRCRT